MDGPRRRSQAAGKQSGTAQSSAKTTRKRSLPPQRSGSTGRHAALAAGLAALAALLYVLAWRRPAALRPFPGRPLKQLAQFGGEHAEAMLWGTYRPGYYLGLRMRRPRSLLVGLMWVDPRRPDPLSSIRHEAQQGDGLASYGWTQHDGRGYGLQRLQDGRYNITTGWAKRLCPECGVGGDWGLRVAFQETSAEMEPQQREEERQEEVPSPPIVSLFFYVASEDGRPLQMDAAAVAAALQASAEGQAAAGQPAAAGSIPPLGRWQLHVRGSGDAGASGGGQAPLVNYLGLATPHMHNLTEAVRRGVMASVKAQYAAGQRQYALTLPDVAQPGANVAVFQVTATLPLSFDLAFLSGMPGSSGSSDGGAAAEAQASRVAAVSGAGLQRLLADGADAFERRFADTFGSLASDGGTQQPEGTGEAARAALANMLGGSGYFYGHSLVRLEKQRRRGGSTEVEESTHKLWDTALYSAVPSRSFFPRGFLWDEGFHQLLVRRWDAALSREALAHWLDLMAADGWIPREQTLGEEARARVPAEFVRQSPDAANPPTFFLLLSDMSHRVAAAAEAGRWSEADRADADLLTAAWPRLRAWYQWFNTTQAGPVPGSYRWRGRVAGGGRELNPKTLTSGLDDGPRASHPTDDERHVDLRCWMALASRALATIGANLGLPAKEVRPFQATAAWLEDFATLNALHLHNETGEYRDWGLHTEAVELRRPVKMLPDGRYVAAGDLQRAETGEMPYLQLVPQFGYISLFPLLMRLIPPSSPLLGRQLELLRDEQRLWTPYGLRSLSRTSSLYRQRNTEHDAPYWRGAIWANVNYMAVQALRHYAREPGPHAARAAELHAELRSALVVNIVWQYRRTGYLWEQYDDHTGEGKGSHPFTGWTALVALMAADD